MSEPHENLLLNGILESSRLLSDSRPLFFTPVCGLPFRKGTKNIKKTFVIRLTFKTR
jgi:hypothetical protein